VRGSKSIKAQKKIAVEKGIQTIKYSMMQFSLSLYVLPLIVYSLFKFQIGLNAIFPTIVILSYGPGIILANSISATLDMGYDYQKKASREIKEYLFVGWLGLVYFSILWSFIYLGVQKSL